MRAADDFPLESVQHPDASTELLFLPIQVIQSPGVSLRSAGLYIKDGRIEDVGPADQVLGRHPGIPAINGRGYMAIPGLINAHTHAAMGFFRDLAHGKENMIETFMFPAEKGLNAEMVESLAFSYLIGGLRSGVTTFVDHYYFSEAVGRAIERLGMRGAIGETVGDLGGAFPDIKIWDRTRDMIERWPFSRRVRPVLCPHAADTVSEGLLTEMAAYGKANGLPLHMHLSQTRGERERVLKRAGASPVMVADRCGALHPESIVAHLVTPDAADLDRLAATRPTIAFCPASQVIYEFLAPIREFMERDIPLALGTDCAASNDTADVLSELRIAALFARDRGVDWELLKPPRLMAMVTTQPAKVLRWDHEIGTLEKGKAADVVFLRRDVEAEPIRDAETSLIFSMGNAAVRHVMIDGVWRLWNRDLVGVSERDLSAEYQWAIRQIGRPE